MAKWDAGRFLNTISYFGAIPILSDVNRWLTGTSDRQSTTDGGRNVGIVLVIGALGEIGELIIQQLLRSGYRVRATISDEKLTPFNVPDRVEFVQVELDRYDNLIPQIMQGIRAIIICPEFLTADSDRHLSELIAVASSYLPVSNQMPIFDFTQPDLDLQASWGSVDDVVMGGVSKSGIRLDANYAIFSGNVSTDNAGGFASVRTRNFTPSLNLSNYQGIELRVKGDGQRYKFFLRTDPTWDGVGYASSFDTRPDDWMIIRIPFSDLVPIFRAKTVADAPSIDSQQICSMQLMLSKFEYDRQLNPSFNPGYFSLQFESISAYGGKILPQLAIVTNSEIDPNLLSTLQTSKLPYSIVKADKLDPQMVALIAVKCLTQPETVGQILGR
jgi:Complex I intermediate-associated protein 30 (CIA30)